eukprot:TRINITY_DN3619_c0_g1_i1.p1 TRINITY_DN3619_c0_g1~~TRINITY_DN3619_c0_g1_i1.p1  ORF type:complete len:260 (+),score=81.28 TRINITY_DN3619_c0_g1_i1:143-922(+)
MCIRDRFKTLRKECDDKTRTIELLMAENSDRLAKIQELEQKLYRTVDHEAVKRQAAIERALRRVLSSWVNREVQQQFRAMLGQFREHVRILEEKARAERLVRRAVARLRNREAQEAIWAFKSKFEAAMAERERKARQQRAMRRVVSRLTKSELQEMLWSMKDNYTADKLARQQAEALRELASAQTRGDSRILQLEDVITSERAEVNRLRRQIQDLHDRRKSGEQKLKDFDSSQNVREELRQQYAGQADKIKIAWPSFGK